MALKDRYWRLFGISANKESVVAENGRWVGDEWRWEFQWRRGLLDRELFLVNNLLQDLIHVTLKQGVKDFWCWLQDLDGGFSVKSAYQTQLEQVDAANVAFFSLLWASWAPSKVLAHYTRKRLLHRPIYSG